MMIQSQEKRVENVTTIKHNSAVYSAQVLTNSVACNLNNLLLLLW